VLELLSLIDHENHSPSLPTGHPFINVQSYYSSSTVSTTVTGIAIFIVYFSNGVITNGGSVSTNYLWPVRGP
jgi:hypothetical protein